MVELAFPFHPLIWTVLCLFVTFLTYSVYIHLCSAYARFLRQQDHAGRKEWFASKDSLLGSRAILSEGYKKWSKRGQIFAFPLFGGKTTMIIPPDQIHEFLSKPDTDVDILTSIREEFALLWQGEMDIDAEPVHHEVVRHQLTRKLPSFTEAVHQELAIGFGTEWEGANDTEWIDVPAFKTCARIVSRAANRIFSGDELCRNPKYLDASLKYAELFIIAAQVISIIPKWLRPVLAPLITIPKRKQTSICQKWAVPVIKERLQNGSPRDDCISWMIDECRKRGPVEMDPNRICRRLLRLNMVAIHTTSMTMTNTLLDIYSSPHVDEYVSALREECERVYQSNGNKWTKAAVNELHRVDSAIKESMRFSSISLKMLNRVVVHKDGVKIGNTHYPPSVAVAVASGAIHRDPAFWEAPDAFDAFRFSRSREALDGEGNVVDKKGQAIVNTSESFLGFGHGRHACPGRFFASQEMKLMLAHLVMTYDVRIKGERLPNIEFKTGSVPSSKTQLQVRLCRK